MPDVRKAIGKMLKAADHAKKLDALMVLDGYSNNPYLTIYGDIAEALVILLGETTETFDETVTFNTIMSDDLWEDRVDALYNCYLANNK